MSRVGHGKFDLVIMNPPFTRPSNHEGDHEDVPIPAYAAFETNASEQRAMSGNVKALTKGAPSNDYAGLASHFSELAQRKIHGDGTVAMVLPLSALSGGSWNGMRKQWESSNRSVMMVTISNTSTHNRSFSADTGMAECLLLAVNSDNGAGRKVVRSARS